MAKLEDLPNELIIKILKQISSPSALVTAIKGCPRCYRSFKEDQPKILAGMVTRWVHPEIAGLALTTCDGSPRRRHARNPFESPHYRLVDAFRWELADHFSDMAGFFLPNGMHHFAWVPSAHLRNGPPVGPQAGITDEGWTHLFRLCYVVEFFMQHFTESAHQRLKLRGLAQLQETSLGAKSEDEKTMFSNMIQSASLDTAPELSDAEKGRLQRAFFAFEVIRKVYASQGLKFNQTTRKYFSRWLKSFVKSLPSAHAEELYTILVFLLERSTALATDAQRHIDAALGKPGRGTEEGPSRGSKLVPLRGLDPNPRLPHLSSGYLHRGPDGRPDLGALCVDRLLSLGLPFLRHLHLVDVERRTAMISAFTVHIKGQETMFLPRPISLGRIRTVSRDPNISYPNLGHKYVRNLLREAHPRRHRLDKGVLEESTVHSRQMGSAFWNDSRLLRYGFFSKGHRTSTFPPLPVSSYLPLQSAQNGQLQQQPTLTRLKQVNSRFASNEAKAELLNFLEY